MLANHGQLLGPHIAHFHLFPDDLNLRVGKNERIFESRALDLRSLLPEQDHCSFAVGCCFDVAEVMRLTFLFGHTLMISSDEL